MLVHLGIRDLAVVEALDLEFERGFTVLTGETGAGKSILLTALGLALGDRADSGMVRPGAARAEINLAFDLTDSPAARDWLEANDLAQDDECLIRRIVGQDGRSKAFVNGRPATLQALQELGAGLVEIHGQHAHVRLLKAAEHRRLVDEAANNGELLAKAEALCRRWRTLRDDLERRASAVRDRAAREELLRYQLEELIHHDIAGLDYPALVEEHDRQANIGKLLGTGQEQLEALYEDEARSVNAQLARAVNALAGLCPLAPGLRDTVALLEEAQVQVKEAAWLLRRELERLEPDPARLDWLEQRLGEVHRLARKHHLRPEDLPGHLQALQAELDGMLHGAESLDALRAELDRTWADYLRLAGQLRERRREAAAWLEERVSSLIRELGMPKGKLVIEVRPCEGEEPTPHGFDQVEFLATANPGLPPRALARVASGGELSRLSLAIQVAATDSRTVPTLIFDEVDTGIGGGIAEIVGQKLRLLGRQGRQVLCVTHLPQVAAQGHQHWVVEKVSRGEVTQSSVRKLTGDERKREIARMLGGVRMTPQTLAHAEEMLRMGTAAEG
ncbi:DNA repair protein RecN [Candidatus Methylocalor cossyra]|uniref:DNA repair protein RecN n=1 Tax=Candidatus Methylocalor cossyra TaxID=3108543 RepID=A0ABP1C787_9GAMM